MCHYDFNPATPTLQLVKASICFEDNQRKNVLLGSQTQPIKETVIFYF